MLRLIVDYLYIIIPTNKYYSNKDMLTLAPTQTVTETGPIDGDPLAQNKELADILGLIGSYYTIARDTYRARAFNNASAKIAAHPYAILSGSQARRELTGIGDSIQSAIDEYMTTGTVGRLQELQVQFPDRKATIDYFRSFYGIGPVTAVKLYDQGFRTLEDLWFKANLTDAQRVGIMWREHIGIPIPRAEMDLINEAIGFVLNPYNIRWAIAGSYRREEPSSNDIDLLVEARPDFNMDSLVALMQQVIPATLAQGPTKFMGIFRLSDQYNGHRIDIRIISPESYSAALLYFTGSQRFNILMRQRAIDLGMTLNEYGLFIGGNNIPLPVTSEGDIFAHLKVVYLAPRERTRTLNALTPI